MRVSVDPLSGCILFVCVRELDKRMCGCMCQTRNSIILSDGSFLLISVGVNMCLLIKADLHVCPYICFYVCCLLNNVNPYFILLAQP